MNTSRPLSASRRAFLKGGAVLPAAAIASSQPGTPVPRIRLGKHSISRVICGANPFNGGSHLSVFFNHELRRYYTPDQVIRTLRRCEEVGINCWQAGPGNVTMHRRLLDEGAIMQFLAIDYGDGKNIPGLVQAGCNGGE